MKLLSFLFAALVAAGCTGPSTEPEAPREEMSAVGVPASVSRVEAYRIGEHLVRVVVHNMEIASKLEVELFETPDLNLIQTLTISSITVDGEALGFEQAAGVYVEAVREGVDNVTVDFDYCYAEGGSDMISCDIRVGHSALIGPECRKK